MSIYILLDYVECCRDKGINPTWEQLKQFKKKYWR